ncbi:hypothetical protein [uncultured Tateyamaria sp.]|uniref:hypothetical protein n=1 Tax=uncultured Tateyamaria sp. TaxID=455651 RepID=UPI00261BC811|nr:hypothetical protein [uncultured Tateyamaria sp.]
MENNDSFNAFAVGLKLLDHDGLLTPKLRKHFGRIISKQTSARKSRLHYFRRSTLYQQSSCCRILEATLNISTNAVPEKLIDTLRSTQTPFGSLLEEFAIETKIINRILTVACDRTKCELRLGRQHQITNAKTAEVICHVEEVLFPEAELNKLTHPEKEMESHV